MWHLAVSFDTHVFFQRLFQPSSQFWGALGVTAYVSVAAMLLGVGLGLATALARRSRSGIARAVSLIYVTLVRGTPLIVQLFFIFYGANLFLGGNVFPRELDLGVLDLPGAVLAGIVGLGINEGAYVAEIFRAAIDSVGVGQTESALSVGMTRRMAMRRIVLPQAARVALPPLGNEFNALMKNTSLLAFIGVYEMFQDAETAYSTTYKAAEIFAAVAVWYLVLTLAWSLIQRLLERRLGASDVDPDAKSLSIRWADWHPRRRAKVEA